MINSFTVCQIWNGQKAISHLDMTILNTVPLSASRGIRVTWKPVICPCV
jgi:hypothetical protein